MEFVTHLLTHTIADSLPLLPFLFGAYLLIEFLEHRAEGRLESILARSGRLGVIGGALLGCVPQCGFSIAAANFYAGGIVSAGTLAAVFLSTSDEAIPLMLARPDSIGQILPLLLTKIVIALAAGFAIDLLARPLFPRRHVLEAIHDHCQEEHCGCEESLLKGAVHHTLQTFAFIFLFTLVMTGALELIGEETLSRILMGGTLWQPVVAGLIGLIPNCASSVLITQLYLDGAISFGSVVAGLCTGAGMGFPVLFKMNRNLRENLTLLGLVYIIGVAAGILLQVLIP